MTYKEYLRESSKIYAAIKKAYRLSAALDQALVSNGTIEARNETSKLTIDLAGFMGEAGRLPKVSANNWVVYEGEK